MLSTVDADASSTWVLIHPSVYLFITFATSITDILTSLHTQSNFHYIRYIVPSVLHSHILNPQVHVDQCTKKYCTKFSWRILADNFAYSNLGTMRSLLLMCTTVNTAHWPWKFNGSMVWHTLEVCPQACRQWQGTFKCPLPWCTLMALCWWVPKWDCQSTTVAYHCTTPQPTYLLGGKRSSNF